MPGRIGTAAGVEVRGLAEFRSELRDLANGSRWVRELGQEQRSLARDAAGWMRFGASTRQERRFAPAIQGRGGASGAKISIEQAQRGQRYAGAQGAFFGAKQYPQFPEWVGSSWEVAGPGGPSPINPTLRERQEEIVRRYEAIVLKVSTSASSYFTETF